MKPVPDLGGTSIRAALVDRFIVGTYGGAGSKTLVRGILNQPPPGSSPVNLVRRHHTHKRVPDQEVPQGKKVIYVYGDPAHSIASFFRRAANEDPDDPHPRHANFLARHCRNIEGDFERITADYSLDDFLRSDEDPFGLVAHFHSWMAPSLPDIFEAPHLRASQVVQGVLGETLDVEPVEDDLGLRGPRGHRIDVGGGHVDGDGLQFCRALHSQGVEELPQCVGVLAGLGPHDALADVVHHGGDVLVVTAVRQLVDADVLETIEQRGVTTAGHHPFYDGPDGSPRNAHVAGHRALVGDLGQVYATWSSKSRVKPELAPAHATISTTTPHRGQFTRRSS